MTKIFKMDCDNIDENDLKCCGAILKNGGTVAFPTETVYGLGANALDPEAIKGIFTAKGRPSDNPLIVHVTKVEDIVPLVEEIPKAALRAMEAFWPGPLTILFKKSPLIPQEVTAGLLTVGIRLPSHPIARGVIEAAGIPIAAPSANISGKPSPTIAAHVVEDLMGKVDAIIDGGDCEVGLESTVLDLTGEAPMILRPGGITKEMLEEVLGTKVLEDPALDKISMEGATPKSPGMKYTHYSPRAEVLVIIGERTAVVNKINEMKQKYIKEGKKVGIICRDETYSLYADAVAKSMGLGSNLSMMAANLFRILREFDSTDVDVILAEGVEEAEVGRAIMNRLIKASGYQVIHV